MDPTTRDRLLETAQRFGTPLYVYDGDLVLERCRRLNLAFDRQFRLSYAVKSNPNVDLIRHMAPELDYIDVSSYGELLRAVEAGFKPELITFSGPAKRQAELAGAIQHKIGGLVVESVAEARMADQIAAAQGHRQAILVRINPSERQRKFGVSFSGRASQFGVDEEVLGEALDEIAGLENLSLTGFHIYSGTNSLDVSAIAGNFSNFAQIFRFAVERHGKPVSKLIFGAGFGLPYTAEEKSLDIDALGAAVRPIIASLREDPVLRSADCVLELGRWIVGPAGWLLTGVVGEKLSRGVEFRLMDAGFNNALAACGMMGTVLRRNWRLHNLSARGTETSTYTLAGPLCTSIDVVAANISLPHLAVGDVVAVENSGAYGLTASPTRFISHPEPREVLLVGRTGTEVTESHLNFWPTEIVPSVGAGEDRSKGAA